MVLASGYGTDLPGCELSRIFVFLIKLVEDLDLILTTYFAIPSLPSFRCGQNINPLFYNLPRMMLLQRMTKKFLMIREESIGKSAIFVYHSIIVNKPNSEFVTLLRNVMDRLFGTTTLNLN